MTLLEALVPSTVRRRIAVDPSLSNRPVDERMPATFLIADISGFTALAEQHAKRGVRGAEELKDTLNTIFGRLVDVIGGWGGEVLKFAGDSTLAYWPADPNEPSYVSRYAAGAAVEAQRVVYDLAREGFGGGTLKVRIGIGAGELFMAHVGGTDNRWEIVAAGEAVTAAVRSAELARAGEVVVSPLVVSHLAGAARTEPLADGFARLGRLSTLGKPAPVVEGTLPSGAEPLLRQYVPRVLQTWLDAGHVQWLAEFRTARVLFIGIGSLEYATSLALENLQKATLAVQAAVYRYGGTVNQLVVDDKGTVFVCGWGLAYNTHDDDAVRAVRAALDIRRQLGALGTSASFGIASQHVFAGLRGNERRAEYAMVGSAVNLAARLMQAAHGEILCDRATFEGAERRIDFLPLPALHIKGRVEPVSVYRPVAETAKARTTASQVFGRAPEQRTLAERVDALARGEGAVVVIEAEAGMGKSRLLAEAIDITRARGLDVRVAAGDAIERSAPYHAFRSLFDSMLGADSSRREQRVANLLGGAGRLLPYAALLNPVLGLNVAETDESSNVTPRGRAHLTRDLLVHLLSGATEGQRLMLVIEDAHWLDSASWALVEGLIHAMPGHFYLIGMRGVDEGESTAELKRLRADASVQWLRLGALTPDAARALAASRLGSEMDDRLARFIFDKAEGHPFFTEELVHVLRDKDALRVEDGLMTFAGADASAPPLEIPDTIEGVITSRIDLLGPAEQLTLKVASVLGRTFDLGALTAVHPLRTSGVDIARHLDVLRARDLTLPVESAPNAFLFKHVITQDVAYGLLPYAQRRQLHQTVAGWYEEVHDSSLESFYALLAHHWSRAEVVDRTAHYLEKAGEQAFARYANQEATRFFSEVLQLEERAHAQLPSADPVAVSRRLTVPGRTARRARWERYLGEAHLNLGSFRDGKEHLHIALGAMGLPVPNEEKGWRRGLVSQLATQLVRRAISRTPRRYTVPAAALMREGVRASTRLGGVAYIENRTGEILFHLVRALNVAERLPPTIELAVAYADAGNIAGLIPLHGLAKRYGALARQTADALQDPHTTARVLNRCAIYKGAIGDWSAVPDIESAMELAQQVGDPYVWEESAAIRARIGHLRGEFAASRALAREQLLRATASGTALHRPWAMQNEALATFHLGDLERTVELCNECRRESAKGRSDLMVILGCDAIEALARLQLGELAQARTAAEKALPVILGARTVPHMASPWLSATTQAFVLLWESEGSGAASSTAVQARQALRALSRYARSNLPARTMALLWRGAIEALENKSERARRTMTETIADAERRGLPYERARAEFELGRMLGVAEASSRPHFLRAREEFERLGAVRDVARVDAVLTTTPR